MAPSPDLTAFLTIFVAVFVAELTDKDALLLLALATKIKPKIVFAAGTVSFIITTAIIVLIGSVLVNFIPILWIKVSGGLVMLAYAVWELRELVGREAVAETKEKLELGASKSGTRAFLGMMVALISLDLAGDATEVLTIFFVAHYQNLLLVFVAASMALVGATAVETMLGNRLSKILSPRRLQFLSAGIFLILGASVILLAIWIP